jgi:hypothetical protein
MVADKSSLYPEGSFPPMMVHVTAPADMPAGYTFEAELNGDKTRTFTVEVVSSFIYSLSVLRFHDDVFQGASQFLFIPPSLLTLSLL